MKLLYYWLGTGNGNPPKNLKFWQKVLKFIGLIDVDDDGDDDIVRANIFIQP